MAPKYSSTIEDVVLAIIQQPRGDALLATGNINVNLEAPEVQEREKEIMETLSAVGLNEISGNFLPQCTSWFRDGRKWSMISRGQELRSRTNYIMGNCFHLLQNVAVQDTRHNIDHYLVLGCLHVVGPPGTDHITTHGLAS